MIREKINDFVRSLSSKKLAYERVFDRKSIDVQIVLKDLAKFCRAYESTFLPDARAHAVLEGRREVWLKIQEQLLMTADEIYKLHVIKEQKPRGDSGQIG